MWESFGSGMLGLAGALYSNNENRKRAQEQMDFQERMSSTAHQREINDLKAAGLNPVLSASGAGSSSPQGAMAQIENIAKPGISSALETQRLKKDIDLAEQSIDLSEAQKGAVEAAQDKDNATAKQINAQTKALNLQLPAIGAQAATDKKQADWDNKAMNYDNISNRFLKGLSGVTSAIGNFFSPVKGVRLPDQPMDPRLKEMENYYKRRNK